MVAHLLPTATFFTLCDGWSWLSWDGLSLQVSVTFEDVAVLFTRDEWRKLAPPQRNLYPGCTPILASPPDGYDWVWNLDQEGPSEIASHLLLLVGYHFKEGGLWPYHPEHT